MGRLTPKDWENQSNEIWLKLGYIQMSDEPFRTFISESLRKLAHYEDLEEAGRLITIEPVKGYEDHYGVDRFGNVYSLKGGKVVKRTLSLNKSGYYYVSLKDNDKIKNA